MRIPLPPVPLDPEVVTRAQEYAAGRHTPAEPRDAATVVLLREGRGDVPGPEVYLLRRQASMAFAAGMAVFPGGGVDPRDFDAELSRDAWAGPSPADWAVRLGVDEHLALALVCAAVRETFEESGVLLAGPSADEVVADTTGDDWEADRVALESRELAFTAFLARRGLVVRTDLLGLWDAWTTPVFEPRRFRTWFFVAALPEGQRTRDVSRESSSVVWLPAATAVEQAEADELAMMPPTYLTCLDVAAQDGPAAALAEAATREAVMFTPTIEQLDDAGDRWTMSMPDRMRPVVAARRAASS
ncbi:MAG: NUDIX hydrolase [Nocardioides alkalitolerans]